MAEVKNSLHIVKEALIAFDNSNLKQATKNLLVSLGYSSEKTAELGTSAESFLGAIEQFRPELGKIDRKKIFADDWKSCEFIFQITNDEIPSLAIGQIPFTTDNKLSKNQIESFVFIAIDLIKQDWSRTALTTITRELNKRFPMPAIILFKHEALVSLAVIDRRQNLKDNSRDVIESRISVIKDIDYAKPHRAHLDVLASLYLPKLGAKRRPNNFRELYEAWIETLSTQKLNEAFYKQLAWWYLWAVKEVEFPSGGGNERNNIGVIRLLTRLIFVWFIKERGLVKEALFDKAALKAILHKSPDEYPNESNYYRAILQNLFFATLNQEMGEDRRWARTGNGVKTDYLISLVYRYQEEFQNPDTVLQEYFAKVPFLNGGLFECLDEHLTEVDIARKPELKDLATKEGNGWVMRVDGFSRRPEAQAKVPNKLFFGGTEDAELNTEFETKGKRYAVNGLIDLLNSYKFTIDENTPLDEEVALDPELLGKVFENLLASYNPDTKTTARKQSGSFYTPREVVDYMVDEALIAYFARKLPNGENRENEFRTLLSHADNEHQFTNAEADLLVAAIENLKVLDPACGSGAFPMGMLTKLFKALKKLDPNNKRWQAQNLAPLQQRLSIAEKTLDPIQRDNEIDDAEAALAKHKQDFASEAYADYTRKLYLIEKCIYGSDIQPIAVQIAKLRFFIALIVSQPIDVSKPNWNITPLPNLETKIVAANTLFGVPRHGVQGSLLDDPAIAQKEAELREANSAYFTSRTRATKKRRKEKVQKLHEELVELLKRDGFVTPSDAERMARWDPFDQNRYADFFDVEWMFGMPRARDNSESVFDIVIANPPYVRQEEIKEIKPLLKDVYKYDCFTGTADLFVYFYERSVKLLKPHGALSFITSNKWYRSNYGENLRLFMATQTRLKNIIDFGDEAIFTAIAYPTIVIAIRREKAIMQSSAENSIRALNWSQDKVINLFPTVFQEEAFLVPQSELKKEGWNLEPPSSRELVTRMKKSGRTLRDVVKGNVYIGVKTALNKAYVIDSVLRDRLVSKDKNSAEIIKPFLRGRDIKRWNADKPSQYLIRIESSENVMHPWSNMTERDAEQKFAECYPSIYEHFQPLKQSLINRSDKGKYYWELRSCSYWREFDKTKIIWPDIALYPQFCWSDSDSVVDMTAFIITGADKWLLSILNSSTWFWYFSQFSSQIQNGYYRFKAQYCESVPIPELSSIQKGILNTIVSFALVTNNPQYERLLNGLVFELYFSEDLHNADIHLFDACERVGIDNLHDLNDGVILSLANEVSQTIFDSNHEINGMLFDLRGLEVVRIIEGDLN